MNAIERRIRRLESKAQTSKDPPRYLVVAGPVSVIDRTVRVVVSQKRPAA